jgi:ribosomal protein S18 acetylase RimI-like enzyme
MIEVRPAVPADAESIAEVHARSHREAYERLYGHGYPVPTAADRLMYWRHALGGPGPTFVATAKGQIVGFGHATADRIDTLYVLASHHRCGIGRMLLSRLLETLRENGIVEAAAEVAAANAAAIAFYAAHAGRVVDRSVETDRLAGAHEVVICVFPTAQPPRPDHERPPRAMFGIWTQMRRTFGARTLRKVAFLKRTGR